MAENPNFKGVKPMNFHFKDHKKGDKFKFKGYDKKKGENKYKKMNVTLDSYDEETGIATFEGGEECFAPHLLLDD